MKSAKIAKKPLKKRVRVRVRYPEELLTWLAVPTSSAGFLLTSQIKSYKRKVKIESKTSTEGQDGGV